MCTSVAPTKTGQILAFRLQFWQREDPKEPGSVLADLAGNKAESSLEVSGSPISPRYSEISALMEQARQYKTIMSKQSWFHEGVKNQIIGHQFAR